ncbi:MAG: hypothetical protein JAZ03_13720 [Candidatus Thiodiazotropha taylori]|nr:hypothetical protein [Candidatus Thiodiazotropha taylori]MCW4334992.1 hypothetical protein [Candidatus Thiodiazotropha endolucinida]
MAGRKRGLRNRERGDETDTMSKFSESETETECIAEQAQLSENVCENREQNSSLFTYACRLPDQRNDLTGTESESVRDTERRRTEGNVTYTNPCNADIQNRGLFEAPAPESLELRSAMKEMATSIVESIRESNKSINDNLRDLASNLQSGLNQTRDIQSNQTRDIQSNQTRLTERRRISRAARQRRHEVRDSSDCSDSSGSGEEIGISRASDSGSNRGAQSCVRYGSVKLPNFTGKESWKVWFNRFTEIAERKRWSNEEKLVELLPRLQGAAGEFVFGQLQKSIRGNYDTLVSELNSRFRIVETKKTYGAQFSKRNQKVSETAEEYAAELKRLYDKAYSKRDSETRQEDLLRRFLDGLYDDKARFQVEYVKEPKTIDEAVFFVVDFEETRRKPSMYEGSDKKMKRQVRNFNISYSDSDCFENETEQQVSSKKRRPIRKANNGAGPVGNQAGNINKGREPRNASQQKKGQEPRSQTTEQDKGKIEKWMCEILQKISQLENDRNNAPAKEQTGLRSYQRTDRPMGSVQCYSCLNYGHYSRNCPYKEDKQWHGQRGDNSRKRTEVRPRQDETQYGNQPQVNNDTLNF